MKIFGFFLAFICILIIWYLVSLFSSLPSFILPSPQEVFFATLNNFNLLVYHLFFTIVEIFLGLSIGLILGVLTAILLASSKVATTIFKPTLVFSQALPVFALAPILTLWFGYGLWSKVVMAILIIFFPITFAFFDGLVKTPKGYLDLAKTMGASDLNILFKIRIPNAIPFLGSGVRLAAVYAPIGAVIGEWVGSSNGLGYLMLLANGRVKIDLMFASMLFLGILSIILYFLADYFANLISYEENKK